MMLVKAAREIARIVNEVAAGLMRVVQAIVVLAFFAFWLAGGFEVMGDRIDCAVFGPRHMAERGVTC